MWIQGLGVFLTIMLAVHLLATAFRKICETRAIDRVSSSEIAYLRMLTVEAEIRTRVQRERIDQAWHGWRKFRVLSIKKETETVNSFYLVPHDKKNLPPFMPGQHIALQLKLPGQAKSLIRCYSLSCSPNQKSYRISVKREGAHPDAPSNHRGLVSNFLHDAISEGDFIDVKSPSGAFSLDLSRHTPIVLIGGGIGITPVFSMLDAVISQGSRREVWFFLGVRNRRDHVMYTELAGYANQHNNFRLVVCYSDPTEGCRKGEDYHYHGFVSVDLMRDLLHTNNYDFYFCGPPGMMESLHRGFRQWGVPNNHLHFEAFGPATVGKMAKIGPVAQQSSFDITFIRSGKKITWNNNAGSILDSAEAHGVHIDSGCRAGNCGTCTTAVKSGEVDYLNPPGELPEEGACLVCAAIPISNLELDA